MSNAPYDIDNDDNLFSFDPYEVDADALHNASNSLAFARESRPPQSSHDAPPTSEELVLPLPDTLPEKGKQVSMPMPIRPCTITHDLFDVSPSNAAAVRASSSFAPSDFSSFSPSSSSFAFSSPASSSASYRPFSSPPFSGLGGLESLNEGPSSLTSDLSGKGKSREMPPTLPPLTFYPSEISYEHSAWMSPDDSSAGPSSYSGAVTYNAVAETQRSPTEAQASPSASSVSETTDAPSPVAEEPAHAPLRCKSLSSLSIDSSVSTATVRPKRNGPIRSPSHLARKFIFGKRNDGNDNASADLETSEINVISSSETISGRAWYTAPGANELNTLVTRPPLPSPVLALEMAVAQPPSRGLLKHKGRSHSAPLPFSALDYVPFTATDVFEPLPLVVKNYFDEILPRELRIHILRCLIQVHIKDHQNAITSGRWSVNRASSFRGQWVGKDKGIKELVKLSRVSKSWRSLVFDGELWIDVQLEAFPGLPQHVLERISQTGGPFVRTLNVAGHVHLDSKSLLDIASNLCLMASQDSLSYTQLTFINLRGCTALTTRSLHHLLIRSRSLEKLILKGLGTVSNTTCEILATYCPNLVSLDLSRCQNMDAEGIRFMAQAAIARKDHLRLKELRVSGLKHTSDTMMEALGKATPYLEVLDLSYARQLHNSALEAFVACDNDDYFDDLGVDTVSVSARDLGRDANDSGRYRRRVTRLRHLNLSFCLLLTDTACANLSYSLPRLEYLEMAGIGSDLKDAGLIRLLERTPFIKRLDLEDATDVTDALLVALTPVPDENGASSSSLSSGSPSSTREPAVGNAAPQPGQELRHLSISYVMNISPEAMLNLIRACPKLTVLEADNTRIGSTVMRDFVRLSRERRLLNAKVVAVDCRGVGESLVKELSPHTRPRQGWRSYGARRLYYLDARDENEEDLKIGQDECDETRVVLKSFYSWQTVDAVKANREKRRKSAGNNRRNASGTASEWDEDDGPGGSARNGGARWWSPGGRRSGSGRSTPLALADLANDGCRAM